MNNFARNLRMSMGMLGGVPSARDARTKAEVWENIRQRNAAREEQENYRSSHSEWSSALRDLYRDTPKSERGRTDELPLRLIGGAIAEGAHRGGQFLQKGYDNIKDTIDIAKAPKPDYKNVAPKYFNDWDLADVSDFNDVDTTRDFYVVNNHGSGPGGHMRIGYKNGRIATVYLPDEDFGDPIYGRKNVEDFFRSAFNRDDYDTVFVSASEPGKFAKGGDTDDNVQYPFGKHYYGKKGPFQPGKVFALNNKFGGKYHKEYGM